MPSKKYFEGQNIGPLGILFIKELPRKNSRRIGLFKCPVCEREDWETGVCDVVSGKATKCIHCRTKIDSYKMTQYGKKSGKDLTNRIFGKLKVIRKATIEECLKNNFENEKHIIWQCQCSCGNFCLVPSSSLTCGKVLCCKKCRKVNSYGELKIKYLLEEANISFVQEKSFKSCTFKETGKRARFDFYVQNKYLIEYDGIQRFESYSFSNWNESLEKRQEKDNFKTSWCKKNNIPLIRIPYTHFDELKLEDLLLTTSKFLVK